MGDEPILKDTISRTRALGNPLINSVTIIYTKDGKKFVLKKYKTVLNFLKWFMLRIVTFGTNQYAVWSYHRIQNQINGNRFFTAYGFPTARIIEEKRDELIFEFVNGLSLDQMHRKGIGLKLIPSYRLMGETLARIHDHHGNIGDCKPENVFQTQDGRITIIDLDQFKYFERSTRKMLIAQLWDVHEFVYYTGHFFPNSRHPLLNLFLRAFLRGYLTTRKRSKDFYWLLRHLATFRAIWPFTTFLHPKTFMKISKILNEHREMVP